MGTDRYEKKRDLERSGEPAGGDAGASKGAPRFVIQEHDATTRHWDFRLEHDGVLVSWAVPKGLSTDPAERRLAIRTEDHPLAYAAFEGVIPEGEYGAGAVIVWDRGRFENLTEKNGEPVDLGAALEHGHAVVRLHGEKLTGAYALQRIEEGGREQWLVIKVDDDAADARRNPVSTEPASVLSGKTVEDLAREARGEGE